MNNSSSLKILFVVFSAIAFSCFSCSKPPIEKGADEEKEDYRIKYFGNYICEGYCHDWNEATRLDIYYKDTITLVVKIDSSSADKIYVNNDLIPIDTSGYFSEFYWENYHFYDILFYNEDSIYYYIGTGGLGGGHWGKYRGKKQN